MIFGTAVYSSLGVVWINYEWEILVFCVCMWVDYLTHFIVFMGEQDQNYNKIGITDDEVSYDQEFQESQRTSTM